MPSFETTIEVDVIVSYEIGAAEKGSCDSMGVPEEPSWPEYVDDISWELAYKDSVDKELLDLAIEHLEEGE